MVEKIELDRKQPKKNTFLEMVQRYYQIKLQGRNRGRGEKKDDKK